MTISNAILFGEDFSSSPDVYVDIILPLAVPRLFTYHLPPALHSQGVPGVRVVVPFGKKKTLTGVIAHCHADPPQGYAVRPVMDVLDHVPTLNKVQLSFFEWIAQYYMCYRGEV